jgi:hypothetical protein
MTAVDREPTYRRRIKAERAEAELLDGHARNRLRWLLGDHPEGLTIRDAMRLLTRPGEAALYDPWRRRADRLVEDQQAHRIGEGSEAIYRPGPAPTTNTDTDEDTDMGRATPADIAAYDEKIIAYLANNPGGVAFTRLHINVGGNESRLAARLNALLSLGRVQRIGEAGRPGAKWSLPEPVRTAPAVTFRAGARVGKSTPPADPPKPADLHMPSAPDLHMPDLLAEATAEPLPVVEVPTIVASPPVEPSVSTSPSRDQAAEASSIHEGRTVTDVIDATSPFFVTDAEQIDHNEPGKPWKCFERYTTPTSSGTRRVAYGVTREEALALGMIVAREFPVGVDIPLPISAGAFAAVVAAHRYDNHVANEQIATATRLGDVARSTNDGLAREITAIETEAKGLERQLHDLWTALLAHNQQEALRNIAHYREQLKRIVDLERQVKDLEIANDGLAKELQDKPADGCPGCRGDLAGLVDVICDTCRDETARALGAADESDTAILDEIEHDITLYERGLRIVSPSGVSLRDRLGCVIGAHQADAIAQRARAETGEELVRSLLDRVLGPRRVAS